MSNDAHSIASTWLSTFSAGVASGSVSGLASLFLASGWLREWLVFTWDLHTLDGVDKIGAFLKEKLPAAAISDVRLVPDGAWGAEWLRPRYGAAFGLDFIEFGILAECAKGPVRGHVRLVHDVDGVHRALTVFTELQDLRARIQEYVKAIEAKPYVLVVGSGQTGLNIASRLKQMNLPTLVIDKNPRVGDNWRKRYPSLTLHTINRHHSLLYQPYPSNWPLLTPRDKVADWLETYAQNQDIVVWTDTALQPGITYDAGARDAPAVLRPAHIVLATGALGAPITPALPGHEAFRGATVHSASWAGTRAHPGADGRVVVIGAGNSSIDICQDLALEHAAAASDDGAQAHVRSVTMVQRSPTCVVSRDGVLEMQKANWVEGARIELGDFLSSALPLHLLKRVAVANQQAAWDAERPLHDKLRKAGLKLWLGPEGQGQFLLVHERLGVSDLVSSWWAMPTDHAWLDKGGADLIEQGLIKVKTGVEPVSFTEHGLLMSDGSEMEADLVVFATGYRNMRDTNAALFGEGVIGKTEVAFGLDAEGESAAAYRPSGHPGLWFATGDFEVSRTRSKPLAMQLKAIQLGLLEHDGQRK
ncbi:dimethylaniline monooxygenase (N-oxide-forming) [Epithele typhae]|uniref:dimethylaniline monooxygenase (N-oxide-forming) n=1 Tax=Epithele typhae TaxID=378194 RepID=UPI0020076FFD|nr:dimethylaniline monooxygenase (N-oxide-forming) [Epithele typhae]KAH9918197.1 dimethylaniline monooxygenase (N-oxide-forming) [Epithele typhae]